MSLKSTISRILANDTVDRAAKTFAQAFVAQVIVLLPVLQEGVTFTVVLSVATSAGAAGLSAVWNGVVKPWLDSRQS